MKCRGMKWTALLLALAMVLSFTGCAKAGGGESTTAPAATTEPNTPTTEPTAETTAPTTPTTGSTEASAAAPTEPSHSGDGLFIPTGGNNKGDLLKLELKAEMDATGNVLYYTEAFTIKDFTLEAGDLLCYDVTQLFECGGLGSVDMYVGEASGDNAGDATLRDDPLCVDQNFLRAHPTVNLAGLDYNMWYAREIEISNTFVKAAAGKDIKVLIAVEIPNASEIEGQDIVVLYDNIRIVRNGETVYTIFEGANTPIPEEPVYYLDLRGNEKVETTLSIYEVS